jgi:protein ImuA
MPATKPDIIVQLQRDILRLQGFKPLSNSTIADLGLGSMNNAFPAKVFPLGAIHEFICGGAEDAAATSGFMTGLLSSLMRGEGTSIWISSSRTLFPPALKSFGISPANIIFVDLQKEKDVLWAMEEALKCGALSAVVGEMKQLNFTASRRLQLVVEQSQVTGFIIRRDAQNLNTTACVTRWKITPLPSESDDNLPGIGYPRWNVQLLKVRNGKPGSWQIEWVDGKFRFVYEFASLVQEPQKKTG